MVTPKGKDNNILLIIYELNEKCIPYLDYQGDKIMTYHSLILYYNFMRYLSKLLQHQREGTCGRVLFV